MSLDNESVLGSNLNSIDRREILKLGLAGTLATIVLWVLLHLLKRAIHGALVSVMRIPVRVLTVCTVLVTNIFLRRLSV